MKYNKYKFLSIFFLILGIIFLIGIFIDIQWGVPSLGDAGSEAVAIGLFVCAFVCAILMLSCIRVSGGTVEHKGQYVMADFPPKIVNPTLSTTVQCPFECCCEKHHGKLHEGIDIAPKTPGITGDPVFAVTKGKVFTDTEEGIVRLECKMFTIIYRHLATITCEDGAKVKIGDTIGTMGGSDTEEGIHLHIEFWNNRYNYFVDPLLYFDWGNKPGEMEKENINA